MSYTLSDSSIWNYRQSIKLNTDSIGLAAASDPTLPHNLHISNNAVFNEATTNKFWQQVSSTKGYVAFTTSDGSTVLDYSIKDWDYTGKDAYFDIEHTWDADADTTIYVYYGYVSGGTYPTTATQWANAYGADFKAAFSMNDDPNTSTIQDLTSNNNDLTKVAAGGPAEATGKVGKAQNSDGVDDYAIKSAAITLSDFTIAFWINANNDQASVNDMGIVHVGTATGGTNYRPLITIKELNASNVTLSYHDEVGANNVTSIAANAWVHVVLTHLNSNGQTKLYIAGSLVDTRTLTFTNASANDLSLFWLNTFGRYFKGLLDEVNISDVVRSADWAALLYQSVNKQDDIGTMAGGNYIEVGAAESTGGGPATGFMTLNKWWGP